MPKSWNNGKMMINWQIDRFLEEMKIDLNQYQNYEDLLSFLYNILLDHLHDDLGEKIEECIGLLKRLNS